MVTTISEDNSRAVDFLLSGHLEESELGEQIKRAFEETIRQINSVLKYLATENISTADCLKTKAVSILKTEDHDVILDWRGNLQQKREDGLYEMMRGEDWIYLPYHSLLFGLRDALANAEERKKKQMEAFASRREFVEGIIKSLE